MQNGNPMQNGQTVTQGWRRMVVFVHRKSVVFHKSQKSEPSKLLHQIGSWLTHSLNDCIQHAVVTVIESQPSANNKVIDTETKQLLAASTKYSPTLHRTSNRRIDLHGWSALISGKTFGWPEGPWMKTTFIYMSNDTHEELSFHRNEQTVKYCSWSSLRRRRCHFIYFQAFQAQIVDNRSLKEKMYGK